MTDTAPCSRRKCLTIRSAWPMLNIGSTLATRSIKWRGYPRIRLDCDGLRFGWRSPSVADPSAVCAGESPQAAGGKADAAQEEFFESKVRPILADNCLECHGAEKHKGGLRLDVRAAMLKGGDTGPAVLPGNPDESPLIEAIRYEGDVQMPPKKKLKAHEITALTDWVKRGAFWPDPRPGIAPRAVETPSASATGSKSITDRASSRSLVLVVSAGIRSGAAFSQGPFMAAFTDRSIHPRQARTRRADRRPLLRTRPTLIRRAFFDLIGLPPTPEDIAVFCHGRSTGRIRGAR